MENDNRKNEVQNKSAIRLILERVATDGDFKSMLLSDPDLALKGYELNDTQMLLVRSLGEEDLDKFTPDNIDDYFESDETEPHTELQRTVIGTIFERVVTDESFKALLVSDPDAALGEYELSEHQILLIKTLSAEDLDKLTPDNIEEFSVVDSAVYVPEDEDLAQMNIFVEEEDEFSEFYDMDDFEDIE